MPSPINTPTVETIFEQDWRAAQQKFEDTSGWARKAAVVICVPCVPEHPDDTPEGQSERSRIEQETDSVERIIIAAAAPHISALNLQKDALDKELYFTKVERDHFKEELTKFKLIEENLQDSCKRMQASLAASQERVRELQDALAPFAKFACDEPHLGETPCPNCVARALLKS